MKTHQTHTKGIFRTVAAVLTASALLFSAAGCGNTANNSASPSESQEASSSATESATQSESPSEEASSAGTAEVAATSEAVMKKVGITQFADHASLDNCRIGFIEGMEQGGYIEGENVEYDFQNAQTDTSQTATIATKFVNDKVDLICAIATPSAIAAANAIKSTDIPLVFNAISEPVDAGLITSFEEPGGNITGVSDKLPSSEQVSLIQDVLPDAKTVGVLYSSSEASSESQANQFKEAAEAAGLEVQIVTIAQQSDIASALDALLPHVDCMQNLLDNTVVAALPLVLEKSNAAGKPVFGSEEEQVINGCVASAGVDYIELGIQCGLQAAAILNGTPASEIPVGLVKESSLTVNEEAMKELGLTLSPELASRATVVDAA